MISYEFIDYRTKLQFFINFCFGRQFHKVYRWLLEYHSYFVAIFLPGTTFLQSLQKVQYLLTETMCDGLNFWIHSIWVAYCTKYFWILSKIICYWLYIPHFMLILQVHCCPLNFLNSGRALNTHRFLYISFYDVRSQLIFFNVNDQNIKALEKVVLSKYSN